MWNISFEIIFFLIRKEIGVSGCFSTYIDTYKLINTIHKNVVRETRNVASALNTTDRHVNWFYEEIINNIWCDNYECKSYASHLSFISGNAHFEIHVKFIVSLNIFKKVFLVWFQRYLNIMNGIAFIFCLTWKLSIGICGRYFNNIQLLYLYHFLSSLRNILFSCI